MPATAYVLADATVTQLLAPVSAANTAAATSTGFDTLGYDGLLNVVYNVGAITGSITNLKVQASTDNSTFNDLTSGGVIAATTTANTSYNLAVDTRALRTSAGMCRYIRVIGTIATGPVLVSASITGFKKNG